MRDLIAQGFGIIGLIILVSSFQFKKNSTFFFLQGTGSFMFFLNFIMIGAYGGAFFNLFNLVRGLLFIKNTKKPWKLATVIVLYTVALGFSYYLDHTPKQIILVGIIYASIIIMSVAMWQGDAYNMRIYQISVSSPAWMIHNIFNFSLGGLLCETFNVISTAIFLFRFRKSRKS